MRILVVIALLVLSVPLMVGCRPRGKLEQPTKSSLPLPSGSPKRPVGAKAIEIKPGGTLTKEDVAAYLKQNNLPKNMGSTDQFQVDSLEFITSAEVSKRLQGALTGLDENDRIAFATLSGNFIFTGPPPGKPRTFERAYAAFDASNGNLLMIGTL
jgi:hypothetical protein